jgi:AcrR family transcriptional regulator
VKGSDGGRARKTYKKTRLLREELLDAAEELFAERGFEKTSVRDITNHLGVRLAAVNYHFDSKLNLLIEMIHRRAGSLNHARQVRLDSVEIDKEKPYETVRALICAMWEPLLQYYLSGDSGWHH